MLTLKIICNSVNTIVIIVTLVTWQLLIAQSWFVLWRSNKNTKKTRIQNKSLESDACNPNVSNMLEAHEIFYNNVANFSKVCVLWLQTWLSASSIVQSCVFNMNILQILQQSRGGLTF